MFLVLFDSLLLFSADDDTIIQIIGAAINFMCYMYMSLFESHEMLLQITGSLVFLALESVY